MNPKELFEQGRLTEAVAELTQAVKSSPGDQAQRVFLFELLCFTGAFDRAAKQLDVLATQAGNLGTELAIGVYRALLTGEESRRRVFLGDGLPKFLTPPDEYVNACVLLLKKIRSAPQETAQLLDEAEERLPAIGGVSGAHAFSSFRDADDRIAGVLEVLHGSDYVWIPLDRIARVEIVPPKRLRELMWMPARLELVDQPVADVFLPALYPDSHQHPDDQVKLGRTTDWQAINDAVVTGAGMRVFLVDGEPVALPELGGVAFVPQQAGAGV
jgi:type VI secretion system protein ImpE